MLANLSLNVPDAEPSIADAIASAAPFSDLQMQILDALAAAASRRRYAAGETVFAIGQYDGSEFLVVQSGRLKASHVDPSSGSMIFEETPQGAIYGLAPAVVGGEADGAQSVTIVAERDSEVVAVDAQALRELASQRPSLTRALMLHFAGRLAGARAGAEESSPEQRVYAALCAYVERDAVTAAWRIARMPKHRELADRADVDEAVAASSVAKLIQSGVARRDYPGLIIDDIAQLNRLAR